MTARLGNVTFRRSDHSGRSYGKLRFAVVDTVQGRRVVVGHVLVVHGPDGLRIVKASTPDDLHRVFLAPDMPTDPEATPDTAVRAAEAWLRNRQRYVVVDSAEGVEDRYWSGEGRGGATWTYRLDRARWFWSKSEADLTMHQLNRRTDKRGNLVCNTAVVPMSSLVVS